jgi:hypothetical protein
MALTRPGTPGGKHEGKESSAMTNKLRDDQIESPFSDEDIRDHHYFSNLRRRLRWQLE